MSTFVSYEVAVQLIRELRELVPQIKKHDPDLADQIHRAATSALNLAEGQRRTAGNQRKHYEIAHGSANEVRACLDVAEAWGWIADPKPLRAMVNRLLALLWGLTAVRQAPAKP
ncbi:MAG TPA: four helix bundle protein [Kofleriaceae bacterium]|nr:four helix bundle protein [Kofleriaceae bacterium]